MVQHDADFIVEILLPYVNMVCHFSDFQLWMCYMAQSWYAKLCVADYNVVNSSDNNIDFSQRKCVLGNNFDTCGRSSHYSYN